MEFPVFLAVLAAAVMHAGWNAVIKLDLDRFSAILLLALMQSGLAAGLLLFVDWPGLDAWGWILVAGCLHAGYKIFLIRAYQHGDLGQVYPIARGTAPLIVAVFGALVLGEALSVLASASVIAIGGGVMLMAMKGGAGPRMSRQTLVYALITAGFTASYTMVDGVGARLAGTASGFAMWMFVADGVVMVLYALAVRGPVAFRGLRASWRPGLIAGALSLGSYWIAIWAMTQAPIAMVAALRETSVLFAILIAALVLREPTGPWRWGAGGLIVAGVVLMRL
ncbi:MAG: EamA family transporter [Alphaproteobacteria bacterium]|nr:EamA family transporter [Alphaproteobacteria bacterium]